MSTLALATELRRRIDTREVHTGVIGLGYVGLPLAVEFARAGYNVVGLDIDPRKVEAINRGTSYIPDVSEKDVAALIASGRLRATSEFWMIRELDAIRTCHFSRRRRGTARTHCGLSRLIRGHSTGSTQS